VNEASRLVRGVGVALGMGLLMSCSSPTEPATFAANVQSGAHSIHVTGAGMADVTGTNESAWTATWAPVHSIGHYSTIDAGSGRVTVRDANGSLVYDGALRAGTGCGYPCADHDFTILPGPGVWTLEISLSGFSGDLDVSLFED